MTKSKLLIAERLTESVKGKTVAALEHHTPNLRIIFTDRSYLDIEAVECGDFRCYYHPNNSESHK
jgi:hypothetical protein